MESGANIVDDTKNKPWRLRHLAGVLRINFTLFVAAALLEVVAVCVYHGYFLNSIHNLIKMRRIIRIVIALSFSPFFNSLLGFDTDSMVLRFNFLTMVNLGIFKTNFNL